MHSGLVLQKPCSHESHTKSFRADFSPLLFAQWLTFRRSTNLLNFDDAEARIMPAWWCDIKCSYCRSSLTGQTHIFFSATSPAIKELNHMRRFRNCNVGYVDHLVILHIFMCGYMYTYVFICVYVYMDNFRSVFISTTLTRA